MPKTIAYITDIHLDEQFPKAHGVDARQNWNRILEDIISRDINEIIFGGDIGEKESYECFFKSLKNFKLNITLGNHDDFWEVHKYYKNYLHNNNHNEFYYSFEDGYFKYIFLDSSSNAISETQFQWLVEQLIAKKKILLFIHHPVFGVHTIVDRRFPLQGRETIKTLLLQYPNEIHIFCGHYHINSEKTEANIKQIITSAASFQIGPSPETLEINNTVFGYRIIKINEEKIDTELILLN